MASWKLTLGTWRYVKTCGKRLKWFWLLTDQIMLWFEAPSYASLWILSAFLLGSKTMFENKNKEKKFQHAGLVVFNLLEVRRGHKNYNSLCSYTATESSTDVSICWFHRLVVEFLMFGQHEWAHSTLCLSDTDLVGCLYLYRISTIWSGNWWSPVCRIRMNCLVTAGHAICMEEVTIQCFC